MIKNQKYNRNSFHRSRICFGKFKFSLHLRFLINFCYHWYCFILSQVLIDCQSKEYHNSTGQNPLQIFPPFCIISVTIIKTSQGQEVFHGTFITCNPYKNKKITSLSHNTAPQTGYKDSGRTFLQNSSQNFRHQLRCVSKNPQNLIFQIDVSVLEPGENDWNLRLYSDDCPDSWMPVIGSRLRMQLILGSYSVKKDTCLFFPMGSTGHRFILRSRPLRSYDSPLFHFKELAAFGLGKLMNPLFKKRHIWLIYEKYCISAQDNGFYFFPVLYETSSSRRKEKHFLYIGQIFPTMEGHTEVSIMSLLSFCHLLYLMTAAVIMF